MAQTFPTTAKIVYDTLAADTTFTDLLGTYNFKAGQDLTALSLVSPGEDLPSVRNVTGVECVIQDTGNTDNYSYISGDAPRLKTIWGVFLIAWDGSTGADVQAAANRVMARFGGAKSILTVATPDGIGSLVQTKVEVMSDMPVLPA